VTVFDIRNKVRAATQAVHEQLESGIPINIAVQRMVERSPDGPRRLQTDPEMQRALHDYGLYLLANLVSERLFELVIDHTPGGRQMFSRLGIAPETPPASERIRLDLADLGWKNIDARISRLPVTELALDNIMALAGAQYVRSGSRMGGVMISAIVRKNFGFDSSRGARFLNMHGSGTQSYFRSFLQGFEALPQSDADVQKAIAGANAAFQAVLDIQGEAHQRLNPAILPLRILENLANSRVASVLRRLLVEAERDPPGKH